MCLLGTERVIFIYKTHKIQLVKLEEMLENQTKCQHYIYSFSTNISLPSAAVFCLPMKHWLSAKSTQPFLFLPSHAALRLAHNWIFQHVFYWVRQSTTHQLSFVLSYNILATVLLFCASLMGLKNILLISLPLKY